MARRSAPKVIGGIGDGCHVTITVCDRTIYQSVSYNKEMPHGIGPSRSWGGPEARGRPDAAAE